MAEEAFYKARKLRTQCWGSFCENTPCSGNQAKKGLRFKPSSEHNLKPCQHFWPAVNLQSGIGASRFSSQMSYYTGGSQRGASQRDLLKAAELVMRNSIQMHRRRAGQYALSRAITQSGLDVAGSEKTRSYLRPWGQGSRINGILHLLSPWRRRAVTSSPLFNFIHGSRDREARVRPINNGAGNSKWGFLKNVHGVGCSHVAMSFLLLLFLLSSVLLRLFMVVFLLDAQRGRSAMHNRMF